MSKPKLAIVIDPANIPKGIDPTVFENEVMEQANQVVFDFYGYRAKWERAVNKAYFGLKQ